MDRKNKFKFITITTAFAVLVFIILSNVFKMTQVTEKDFRLYKQGLSYVAAKDYENAYYNFSNISKTSGIYEIALYRQALCADNLNDFDTATKKYKIFIEKYSDSIFAPKAHYSLAQNYYNAKEYSKAEKIFNAIKKNYKDTEYAIASNYYLGKISSQEIKEKIFNNYDLFSHKDKTKEYFIEYLTNAPDGRYANDCASEIISLNYDLNENENFLIGLTYFKNGSYNTAQKYLENSNITKSWAYLAETYRKQQNYSKYREIFEQNYNKYSQYIDEKDLTTFIENYAIAYPNGIKNGFYHLLEISNNPTTGNDYILYRLTKYENKTQKIELYEKIFNNYPNGKYASDALANIFWNKYINREYKSAYKLGIIHARNYPNTIASPKILFWLAKLSEKQGKMHEAKGFYQRILDNYPDDYYAFRANRNLSHSPNNGWKTKSSHRLPEKKPTIKFPIKQTNFKDENYTIIKNIIRLKDYNLLAEADEENKAIQSWLHYINGNYSTSATIARDLIAQMPERPNFSDSIYRLAYQLHYQNKINTYSEKYTLDPYLMTALIREESYFNPEAGSIVGARGLMQLMPTTASFIAQRNGINYTGSSELYNPEKNIHLGCAYFDYAKEILHEDDMLAVASYNGGPNAVKNWKKSLNYKSFDEFIENIPYPETRDYIKKVYRSYWVYLNIY